MSDYVPSGEPSDAQVQAFGGPMNCWECAMGIDDGVDVIQVFRANGRTFEPVGYSHAWHFVRTEEAVHDG